MKNIYDFTLEELEDYFVKVGDKKYRATQIYEFLYKKRVKNFGEMSNIGKKMLEHLENNFTFARIKMIIKQEDKDVKKYLFELLDGERIETVLMYHDYGISVCVSSQVGCNMGCSFCESGRLKKRRNLEAYEIVEQILMIEEDIGKRISHVVVMGIGEPFDNYNNFCDFVSIINHPKGINLGSRHITVSTCGIVPKIYEFASFPYQVNLAISLHAPTDELRSKLMPINKAYPLSKLILAVKTYIEKTNRRVTFEYIMLSGVNDSVECAQKLSLLLKGINCYVNLIPYNETNHLEYKRSSKETILKFYDVLKKNNINVTIRREFGSKINAACGQLKTIKEC